MNNKELPIYHNTEKRNKQEYKLLPCVLKIT